MKYAKNPMTNPIDENPLLAPLFKPDSSHLLVKEQAYQRQMVALAAQGYNTTEISKMTGYCSGSVSNVIAQPRAKEMLTKVIAATTQTEMKAMLEKAGPSALSRVLRLAESEEILTKNPKLSSELNNSIVDRLLGRASQPIEHHIADPDKLSDDEQDKRLAELRAKLAARS